MPVSSHGEGGVVLVLLSAVSKSVASSPAPLTLPVSPLARKGTDPSSGASRRVTCTRSRHISEEYSGRWALGVYSVLSTSCWCVFSLPVCAPTQLSFLQPSTRPVQTKAISIRVRCERFWHISWCWSSCPLLTTWRWPA